MDRKNASKPIITYTKKTKIITKLLLFSKFKFHNQNKNKFNYKYLIKRLKLFSFFSHHNKHIIRIFIQT